MSKVTVNTFYGREGKRKFSRFWNRDDLIREKNLFPDNLLVEVGDEGLSFAFFPVILHTWVSTGSHPSDQPGTIGLMSRHYKQIYARILNQETFSFDCTFEPFEFCQGTRVLLYPKRFVYSDKHINIRHDLFLNENLDALQKRQLVDLYHDMEKVFLIFRDSTNEEILYAVSASFNTLRVFLWSQLGWKPCIHCGKLFNDYDNINLCNQCSEGIFVDLP